EGSLDVHLGLDGRDDDGIGGPGLPPQGRLLRWVLRRELRGLLRQVVGGGPVWEAGGGGRGGGPPRAVGGGGVGGHRPRGAGARRTAAVTAAPGASTGGIATAVTAVTVVTVVTAATGAAMAVTAGTPRPTVSRWSPER